MDKFLNKYRIPTARLQNWDYGWNGYYFITVCTAIRDYYFGDIVNGKMESSKIGKIAYRFLLEIPQRYSYSKLDVFVIVPNHIHAIIIIDKNENECDRLDVMDCIDAINRVSTKHKQFPPKHGGITGNANPMLHNNISRIINWFKGRVTFESHKIDKNFAWQSRFYDHIIRSENSHKALQNYIVNNPNNWKNDEYYL